MSDEASRRLSSPTRFTGDNRFARPRSGPGLNRKCSKKVCSIFEAMRFCTASEMKSRSCRCRDARPSALSPAWVPPDHISAWDIGVSVRPRMATWPMCSWCATPTRKSTLPYPHLLALAIGGPRPQGARRVAQDGERSTATGRKDGPMTPTWWRRCRCVQGDCPSAAWAVDLVLGRARGEQVSAHLHETAGRPGSGSGTSHPDG